MNNISVKLIELLRQIPDHDPNRKLTGPDPALAEKIYEGVLENGRDGIVGLIALLPSQEEGVAWRARYVLHGLAIYAGRPDKQQYRATLAGALASRLESDLPVELRCFLAQELQAVGSGDVASALGKLLDDEGTCAAAAMALGAIRDGAAEQFRAALSTAQGKNRLTIVQALAVLADPASVEAFKTALADADREVRLAAAHGLANLGDPGATDALLKAADAPEVWQRDQMTNVCLLLAERLTASGKKDQARQIYQRLHDWRDKPEDRHIRQAASLGLEALAK